MRACIVHYPKRGYFTVNTPYHAELVAAIKALPKTERTWNRPCANWRIDSKHRQSITAIVMGLFPNASIGEV